MSRFNWRVLWLRLGWGKWTWKFFWLRLRIPSKDQLWDWFQLWCAWGWVFWCWQSRACWRFLQFSLQRNSALPLNLLPPKRSTGYWLIRNPPSLNLDSSWIWELFKRHYWTVACICDIFTWGFCKPKTPFTYPLSGRTLQQSIWKSEPGHLTPSTCNKVLSSYHHWTDRFGRSGSLRNTLP